MDRPRFAQRESWKISQGTPTARPYQRRNKRRRSAHSRRRPKKILAAIVKLFRLHQTKAMSAALNVAVIGTGSLGKEHARIYAEMGRAGLIHLAGIYDIDGAVAQKIAAKHST